MAVTIAETATALNIYSVKYDKQIHQTMRQGLVTESYMTPVMTDHTYAAANINVSDVVQAYQCDFTPKGDTTLDSVENQVQDLKVDIQFSCDDLKQFRDSWMVEWYELGKSLKEWSFPRYFYEKVIIPKIEENLELQVAYKGSFTPPVAGTPGVTVNSADGYGTKIAAAIADGKLTPIVTGALSGTTMVEHVETFHDGLPEIYQNAGGYIFMSPANARSYYRNWRSTFGYAAGNENNKNLELKIDYSNKKIVGLPSMAGSNRFIYAVPGNMIWGRRRNHASLPVIRWQEQDRMLKGLAEFSRLYGFKHWGNTFVNDQA